LEQPLGDVALVCTPLERALFAGLGDDDHETLFYQLWTVKEA